MFIGREAELKQLQVFEKRKTAGIIVCSGRRRIGKSTLIQHFAQNKRFIELYGLAPRIATSKQDQLNHFSELLSEQFNIPYTPFKNWHTALSMLAGFVTTGPVILFLDEISWMAAHDTDFAGKLKGIWDTRLKKNPNLILVLCGSVSSWIQENILEDEGFMGRVSLTIKLEELPLYDINQFWDGRENISAFEKFKLICVTGGVPRYLEEINPKQSAEQNIKRMCFSKGGILVEEFDKIFKDLFGAHHQAYQAIVRALTGAPLTIEAICQRLGIKQSGSFNKKLKVLAQSGFITRDYAWQMNQKKQKLSKYRLSDNYLRFYLKYIEPKKELINKGLYTDLHLDDFTDWASMMGLQFENLVLNNLSSLQKILEISPASLLSASPYFQNKTIRQAACQIDLLIQTKFTYFICEVKFRRKIDANIIQEVKEKINRLNFPKGISTRPVLIYQGELAPSILAANFFSHVIRFEDLLSQKN